jgi:hypothetical protein
MGLSKSFRFPKMVFGILIGGLILSTGPVYSQVISLLPDTQLDRCGDIDTLWVYADASILNVKAAEFKIAFVSTFATADSVIKGSGLDSDDQVYFAVDNLNDSLLVNLAILGNGDLFNGPDTLIGITFTTENEIASTSITFSRSDLRDALNQGISHSNVGAALEIDCTLPGVPILISPANGSFTSDVTPELNWNPAIDAVSYTLEYADNSGFTGATGVSGLTDTTYTPPTLAQGAWYWHVKAIDVALNESNYSSGWSFTVDSDPPAVPSLLLPVNGGFISDNTPDLTWHLSAGAFTYTLQYADNSGFTGAITVSALTDTVFTLPTLAQGAWYWHVQAIDQALNESAYSSDWSFTVDTDPPAVPTLVLPTNGASISDNTPRLTWNPAAGAFTYTLEYADNSGFTGAIQVTGIVDTIYVTPALSDGDWYWHVKSVDQALNESGYSSDWTFFLDTGVPDVPVLASPANGGYTNDNTPALNWFPASGANTYTLEYADNPGFTGSVVVPGLTDTTYTMSTLADGSWYWHVKAVDEAFNESAYSTAWSFTVDTAAPLPPSDLAALPGHNGISLSWVNASGGFHHTVVMRSDWHSGGHDYPEYNNPEGAYPSDTASFDRVYSGNGTTHTDNNDLSNSSRDIYHYAAFTVDSAGNMSAPSTGASATSYWLGDVAGSGGLNNYYGLVYFEDLLILSDCYWTFDGDLNYEPQFDIGPTSNGSQFGLPTTDDVINFEDLVIFAINFNEVAPLPRPVPVFAEIEKTGPLGLTLEVTDNLAVGEEFAVRVFLVNNPDVVKGIHFTIPYDESRFEFVGAARGGGLDGSGYPLFFDGREINDVIDVSLVLLGGNSTIGGSGEIAELTFRLLGIDDLSLSFGSIDLRDGHNAELPAVGKGWEYNPTSELPTSYGLSQNYPNPFNLQARISYQIPEPGFVTLKIYNIQGQMVRALVNEYKLAGYHYEVWNGRNDAGDEIASGVYTFRMESNNFSAARKMVLLK